MEKLQMYKEAQNIARRTMDRLQERIVPGMTEREIQQMAEISLIEMGSISFWYHGVGALVHVGSRTLISQGGREYRAGDTQVQETDIVTVDLAPTVDTCWGDFARTIFLEDGQVVPHHTNLKNDAYREAIECEFKLHKFLMDNATPGMGFEELYYQANDLIDQIGCINLDYGNNLGHSVNVLQQDRIYIEKGNQKPLSASECGCFTFEPHIQLKGTDFGVKRENIYYFDGESLQEM